MGEKKAKNQKSDSGAAFVKSCRQIYGGLISIGLLLWVTVFPLIMHDSYFDILVTKYMCIYLIILGMLGGVILFSLIFLFIDVVEYKGAHAKHFFEALKPKHWKEALCLPDVMLLGFWLAAVISTFTSDYFYEAFWGNEGRYTGLFLMTLYVAAYFLITRFFKPRRWVLELFIASGLVIGLLGMGDFFLLDPLGLKAGVRSSDVNIFTSTLGNINSYTAYVGIVMGLCAGLFATEKNPLRAVWYYLATLISVTAIVMGYSENAYLSLAALLGLMPLLFFQSEEGVWRMPVLWATFLGVVKVVDVLIDRLPGHTIGTESGIFDSIANFPLLIPLIILLLALAVFLWRRPLGQKGRKVLTIGWSALIAAGLLAIVFALYDVNAAGHVSRYPEVLQGYLLFDDHWGTDRGYIWKRCVQIMCTFPLFKKLFGYGPDTFGILTVNLIYPEMGAVTGRVYDSPHNEYLQYLITNGIVGLGFYLAFLVTAGRKMLACVKEHWWVAGVLAGACCYVTQAVVNLNLPIVAPAFWLMMDVGVAVYYSDHQMKKKAEETA